MERIDVGVLGATGMVGQQFAVQLTNHPWFNLAWVGASERSEGKAYRDAAQWRLADPQPAGLADLQVQACEPGKAPKVVFSAMDAGVAGDVERAFAEAGHIVVSNARNFRMQPDVPLLIPEVNADHLQLIAKQRQARGWPGAIVTNPNCSTIMMVMVLAALRQFELKTVMVSTMQAVSGAGYPGLPSFDILGNVVPFIGGEEEKIESESRKLLGSFSGGDVTMHPMTVSAHCNRVPVIDGHTEAVSVAFGTKPSLADVRAAIDAFRGRPQELELPSAPARPLEYHETPGRPQPRLDVGRGRGMTVSVGRLRPCPVLDFKFVCLGHNTVRGAAGAAVLNAELMHAEGLLA
jgi:aspartate-semialdehyde dehydrogenase